jgi:hypothetical protein
MRYARVTRTTLISVTAVAGLGASSGLFRSGRPLANIHSHSQAHRGLNGGDGVADGEAEYPGDQADLECPVSTTREGFVEGGWSGGEMRLGPDRVTRSCDVVLVVGRARRPVRNTRGRWRRSYPG